MAEFFNLLCHWKAYEDKIDALAEKLTVIKRIRDDVKSKIDAAEKVFAGLKPPAEVSAWLNSIDGFVSEATSIVDGYANRSTCIGCLPLDLLSSFHLVKKAGELLELADELKAKAAGFSSDLLRDLLPAHLHGVLHSATAIKEEALEKVQSLGLNADRLEAASEEEVVEKIQQLDIGPAAGHGHRIRDRLKEVVDSASSAVKEEVLEKVSHLNPTSHKSLGFDAVKSLF